MELIVTILSIGLFIVVYGIIINIFSAGASAVSATVKTVVKGGEFRDHWDHSRGNLPTFRMKLEKEYIGDNNEFENLCVLAKGVIPIAELTEIGFSTSVFDKTDPDNKKPIICSLDSFQEKDTACFQHVINVGLTEPLMGFTDYVNIGAIPLDFINAPYSGERDLQIHVRMIDMKSAPIIQGGREYGNNESLWLKNLDYTYEFKEKGYEEVSDERLKARKSPPLTGRITPNCQSRDS